MQMLLVTVLVHTLHIAFEDAEIAFNRISVNGVIKGVHVFTHAVLYRAMLGKVLAFLETVSLFTIRVFLG